MNTLFYVLEGSRNQSISLRSVYYAVCVIRHCSYPVMQFYISSCDYITVACIGGMFVKCLKTILPHQLHCTIQHHHARVPWVNLDLVEACCAHSDYWRDRCQLQRL